MTAFERFMKFMTHPVVVLTFIGIIVLSFIFVDRFVALSMHDLGLQYSAPWLTTFTELGRGGGYIIFFFLLALYYHWIKKNPIVEHKVWFLWFCIVIPTLIAFVLKIIFGRARPELLFSDNLYGFYWFKTKTVYFSLPSGHTTTIMALVFGLGTLFPEYGIGLLFAGFIVACSRIILTQHFVSDVLLASYLALIEIKLLKYFLWPRLGIHKVPKR